MAENTAVKPPKKVDVKKLVLCAIFLAIMAVLGATGLGVISLGAVGVTTLHIFVIIGSIILGVGYGAVLGFGFGLISLLVATYVPFIGSFAFSPFIPAPGHDTGNLAALIVAFVPRILIGVITPLVFRACKAIFKRHPYWPYGIAALVGSLTNSLLVVLFIRLFFGGVYAEAIGVLLQGLTAALLLTVVINGLPEAAVAVLLTLAVARIFVKRDEREAAIQKSAELLQKNTDLEQKNQMLSHDLELAKGENQTLRETAPPESAPQPVEIPADELERAVPQAADVDVDLDVVGPAATTGEPPAAAEPPAEPQQPEPDAPAQKLRNRRKHKPD